MNRRLKRLLRYILVTCVAFAAIAAAVVFHYAQPQQLARLLGEFSEQQLQLELHFAGEAHYTFWPSLTLRLAQPRFNVPGQSQALLAAAQLRIELPWSNLRGSHLDIEHIELDHADLDLDRIADWLARAGNDSGMPDTQAHVRVVEGVLRRGALRLASGIDIDADVGLREIDHWWRNVGSGDNADALLPPLRGNASVRLIEQGGVRLHGLRIDSQTPSP